MKTPRFLFLVVAATLTGCASISVKPGTDEVTKKPPQKVYVEPFDAATGDFKVDRDGAELAVFKSDLQKMMATGISYDLTKRLIPAANAEPKAHYKAANVWVIRGQFVRVEQGSRLLRGAIGFGLGATKLVCDVQVYDLTNGPSLPFLTFTTTGGSNAEPGAITAIATDPLTIAIEAVTGGAGNVAHGLTEDSARTAREITAELSNYMYHRGWITEDKRVTPKLYSD
jgi:hypothetical protein